MANTFKSAMLDVTTTDLTTLITVPTADAGATPPVPPTTNVVKSILVCNDSGSTTEKIDVRGRGRAVKIKYETNTVGDTPWRLGSTKLQLRPDGRR